MGYLVAMRNYTSLRDPKYPRLFASYRCNHCGAERRSKAMIISHLQYHHADILKAQKKARDGR